MNKIIEAMKKLKGPEQDIIGATRGDLPELFKEMGFKVGVEIGVYKGEFTKQFCEAGLQMYGVDPWLVYPDYDEKNGKHQKRLEDLYQIAMDNLAGTNCKLIRKTSMEALADFEDGSLDFVYIDGHHALKYVVEDICEWSKKVKSGGIISGHDFVRTVTKKLPYVCHVKQALRAYTDAYKINDWYILGRKHFPEDKDEPRDRWRSWIFINP